ncbi:MAG: hypothetical protein KIT48_04750 [Pseudolabrys sp.]|nr:hypothetical protein [Pseudolabrys sp.]
MRRVTTALVAFLCLGLGICIGLGVNAEDKGTQDNSPQDASAQLVDTFENVCLETLPLLVGAVERLKKLGFELTPAGDDGMYELWSEKLGLGGHLHLAKGERKPSCGFLTENVTRQEVGPLVEAVLVKWLGTAPERWKIGDPHAIGWQVPAGGNTLNISVATSLSDDPAKGASVTVEEVDRQ